VRARGLQTITAKGGEAAKAIVGGRPKPANSASTRAGAGRRARVIASFPDPRDAAADLRLKVGNRRERGREQKGAAQVLVISASGGFGGKIALYRAWHGIQIRIRGFVNCEQIAGCRLLTFALSNADLAPEDDRQRFLDTRRGD
jgi:hypothetical protein